MDCAYKVGKKCLGFTRYRKHCGFIATLFCEERQRYEAIMAEKKRLLVSEEDGMYQSIAEMGTDLGIGA